MSHMLSSRSLLGVGYAGTEAPTDVEVQAQLSGPAGGCGLACHCALYGQFGVGGFSAGEMGLDSPSIPTLRDGRGCSSCKNKKELKRNRAEVTVVNFDWYQNRKRRTTVPR